MASNRFDRKLAAILYADVEGYSRLIGLEEERTHRTVSAYLGLFTQFVTARGGRIGHFAGDAVLADFDSVLDALGCALEIQREFARRNQDVPDDRKVQFRIGINLGDVIADGHEVHGEGVNIAARLETLAKAGSVCVSAAVVDAVGNKLPVHYEYLGEQHLKNIAQPVRAYIAIATPDAEFPKPSGRRSGASRRTKLSRLAWPSLAAILTFLLLGIGIFAIFGSRTTMTGLGGEEGASPPLPDKPSVVVLPLTNLGGEAKQQYFADGMTADLITAVSKVSGLFVIARNSAFAYRDRTASISEMAKELGVCYVLDGDVRRWQDKVRINVQLVDASTRGQIWAERYDAPLADVLAVQDKVASEVAASLAVNLTADERTVSSRRESIDPRAYDAFLQGWEHSWRNTPEDVAKAVEFFREAVAFEPGFSRGHAALASAYWSIADRDWANSIGISTADAMVLAWEHLGEAMKKPTPLAHQVKTRLLADERQYDEAIGEAGAALALDANDPLSHLAMAIARVYSGEPDRAREDVETAMRLDPHYPPHYLYWLGLAQFGLEQFHAAAATFERLTRRSPDYDWGYYFLAATYAHLGRKQDAVDALSAARRLREQAGNVPYVLRDVVFWPFKRPGDVARLRAGLADAGLR